MGECFITRRVGGGGGDLNFSVIGSTTQPTGRENLIWVNTDTAITEWRFAADVPEAPVAGMVWFGVGTNSAAPFNALKKNGIWVYPADCQQYISGAWVDKTAKTYQGGAWVDWLVGKLYDAGDEYTYVTGGWTDLQNATISRESERLKIIGTQSYIKAHAGPRNKINLGNFNTLHYDAQASIANYADVIVSNDVTSATGVAFKRLATTGRVQGDIDISSLSGEYYIYASTYTGDLGQCIFYLYELTLLP